MDLEGVWEFREEVVYPELFGPVARGIFVLTFDTFKAFGEVSVDPTWLSLGVHEFAPTQKRRSWLYVTSGYSNPWNLDPADYDAECESGSGIEFAIETSATADWAIVILQRMLALDLLLSSDQLGGSPPLGVHDRIPLHGPIDLSGDTPVRSLIAIRPENFSDSFQLPSGKVNIMQFVGVSDQERSYAKANSADDLAKIMRAAGCYPITITDRDSTV